MENQHTDHRQTLHEWVTPEFIPYHRGKKWFMGAGIVFGLLILIGILTQNITMILAFVGIAVVFILIEKREPRMLKVQITDMGIDYRGEFYPFHHINAFWVVYHPPYVHSLYLKIRSGKKLQTLKIELNQENPVEIRQLLINEIPEIEGAGEPMLDLFSRLLRIQ